MTGSPKTIARLAAVVTAAVLGVGSTLIAQTTTPPTKSPPAKTPPTTAPLVREVEGKTLEQWITTIRQQLAADQGDAAVASIAKLPPLGGPAAPFLVDLLHKGPSDASSAARKALNQIGAPAVPALIASMGTEDDGLFQDSARVVMDLGDQSLPLVVDGLQSENPHIRRHCAQLLSWPTYEVDRTPAVPALVALTRDPDSGVRSMAVAALKRTQSNDARVHEALQALTRDASKEIRAAAVEALGSMPLPAGAGAEAAREAKLKLLMEQLRSSDPQPKRAAIEQLRNMRQHAAPAVDALKKIAADEAGSAMSSDAIFALRQIGPAAAAALGELVRKPETRAGAMTALKEFGQAGRAAAPDLVALLEPQQWRSLPDEQRGTLLDVLARLGPRGDAALPALRRMQTDPNWSAQARQTIQAIETSAPIDEPRIWTPGKERIDPLRVGTGEPAAAERLRALLATVAAPADGNILPAQRSRMGTAASLMARLGDLESALALAKPLEKGQFVAGYYRTELLCSAALGRALAGDLPRATALWDEARAPLATTPPFGSSDPKPLLKLMVDSQMAAGALAEAAKTLQAIPVSNAGDNRTMPPVAPGRGEILRDTAIQLAQRGAVDEAAAAALAVDEWRHRVWALRYVGHAALVRDNKPLALKLFDEALESMRFVVPDDLLVEGLAAGRLRVDPDPAALIERVARPAEHRKLALRTLVRYLDTTGHAPAAGKAALRMVDDLREDAATRDAVDRLLEAAELVSDEPTRQQLHERAERLARAPLTLPPDAHPADVERAMQGKAYALWRLAALRAQAGADPQADALLEEAAAVGKLAPAAQAHLAREVEFEVQQGRQAVAAIRARRKQAAQAGGPSGKRGPVVEEALAGRAADALDLRRAAQLLAKRPEIAGHSMEPPLVITVAMTAARLGDDVALQQVIDATTGPRRAEALMRAAESLLAVRPKESIPLLARARQAADALDPQAHAAEKSDLQLRACLVEAYLGRDAEAKALAAAIQPAMADKPQANRRQRSPGAHDLLLRAMGRSGDDAAALSWIESMPPHVRDDRRTALMLGLADRATGALFDPTATKNR